MPQPTPGDVYVNIPLGNMAMGYKQRATNFVADVMFPNIPSERQSALYFKWNREDFYRDDMKLRAPSTPAEAAGYKIATATFFCNVWALRKDIDDQTRANTMPPLNPDRDAVRFLTTKGLINRDVQWGASNFKTGVWGTDLTGVAAAPNASQFLQWDQSGSDPTSDILAAKETILQNTGYEPNRICLGYAVKRKLKTNASIIDRLKYGQTAGGIVTVKDSDLQQLFELDRVVTAGAIKTTSAENMTNDADLDGAATFSFILGKHALLCYAADAPSIEDPSAGYTFSWTGYTGATAAGMRVKRYRWEETSSDRVELESAYDFRVTGKALGLFFSGAVA